jgi:hypothetical protein
VCYTGDTGKRRHFPERPRFIQGYRKEYAMRLGKRERALARLLSAKRLKMRQHPKPTVGKYATAWSRMRDIAGRPAGLRGQSWRWDWRKAASVRKLNPGKVLSPSEI